MQHIILWHANNFRLLLKKKKGQLELIYFIVNGECLIKQSTQLKHQPAQTYTQPVPEFMSQTLRIGKIRRKKHFLCSNMGSEVKNVGGKTGNVTKRKKKLFVYINITVNAKASDH